MFNVGDRVKALGMYGTVEKIDEMSAYPIMVRWDDYRVTDLFTNEGKMHVRHKEPSLFKLSQEEEYQQQTNLIKIKIDEAYHGCLELIKSKASEAIPEGHIRSKMLFMQRVANVLWLDAHPQESTAMADKLFPKEVKE